MLSRRTLTLAMLVALVGVIGPTVETASAQTGRYFGRNKVQYQAFDFEVLKTEHFDIYYYEREAEAAEMAARMAERWYARLSRVLNHEFRSRQPIILYADHSDFEQTNATPSQIDESTGGFTEILKRRVVLPLAGPIGESDHVLGHELVHAFQFDMTGQGPAAVGLDVPGAIRLPLWFIEGMAEYLSIGPIDPFTTMWMRDALDMEEGFPSITDLRDSQYFPYRFGHALWSFVAGNFGEDKLGRILNLAGRTGNALGALEAVLEVPIDDLSARWQSEMETYFASMRDETHPPSEYGRRVIYEEASDGRLNLGPALSPDGSELIYLSERSIFSVEMFLADARTGEIKRRITETAVDPHFESLQFINSAGEWHPDGRRFVFSAVNRGRPVVTVLDVDAGEIEREVRVPEVGEIFTPTWAPDGRRVAFTAMVGGFTDLFVLDLDTEQLTRLTDDPFADLQPAWSPDGRRLAFTTDRFDSDLELLTSGSYQLALYDLTTRQIERLPSFTDQKRNYNPQWSPDGSSLYFVSDHDGVANLYRLEMSSGETYLITDLWTGVSGLTPMSPAISVARQSGDVAFSANVGGPFSFEIYVADSPQVLAGRPAPELLVDVDASIIPPQARVSTELVELLGNARLGLADPVTFERDDYSATLSLDFVSQPTLAFGASDFGVFFAGGASLFFSDLLGNRNLITLLQVNTSRGDFLKGTAAIAQYENRSSRWNWALVGGQVPFVTRAFQIGSAIIDGRQVQIFRETRFFEVNRELSGLVAYPFNRAQRIEFGASARSIDFAAEQREIGIDVATGALVIDRDVDLPNCADDDIFFQNCAPGTINTGSMSAALVYDTSIFGGTSPILGQRYRLEVEPTVGSVSFLTVLGDYRRYLRFAPFTLAGRAIHFGRYGGDSEDPRLGRLFIGRASLVRGYDDGSFEASECGTAGGQAVFSCPVFDRLLGSRLGVANAELRLPLLGGIGVIRAPGVPPIEIGAFFDAGVAWTGEEGQNLGDRKVVKSTGFLARLNLFGFAIAELDFVHPLDRPEKEWLWQFSLTPGF
ncbi:MAG: peptidase S9 [Gemmatimonadota bacterium]